MSPHQLHGHVSAITASLIATGLSVEQQFPALRLGPAGHAEITLDNAAGLAAAMKNTYYEEIYEALDASKTYNVKLVDGGLLQFLYTLTDDTITKHRLAFFPAPNLLPFQNEPELYEEDEIYADMLLKNVVGVPIRFDFDQANEIHQDIHHPKSHLTLGQYKNCRIPVTAPILPTSFARFILRNFYNTAYRKYEDALAFPNDELSAECITANERAIPHFSILPPQ